MTQSRLAILMALCAVCSAGCSRSSGALPPSAGVPESASAGYGRSNAVVANTSFRVLHRFNQARYLLGGEKPLGDLLAVGGVLYGTTSQGGAGGGSGFGNVFSITPAGDFAVVYAPRLNIGAVSPQAALILRGGVLFGTSASGGAAGYGTVFTVTPAGTERILHSFRGGVRGQNPAGPVIDVEGSLYGTAAGGLGEGVFYSLSPSGSQKVIYKFGTNGSTSRGSVDGVFPSGSLLSKRPDIFGTTTQGGTHNFGTVFAITKSGKERVVYDFGAAGDGRSPYAGLISVGSVLYGTTKLGGAFGNGTVFGIDPATGKEVMRYSFGRAPDGANPVAQLVALHGRLYGTTYAGGPYGVGTVFEITTSGKERVLHGLTNQPRDGVYPATGLTVLNGTLYGTTSDCAPDSSCNGTVFALKP
jgi:uncharacterized repeat protein (TIGR03803 family)